MRNKVCLECKYLSQFEDQDDGILFYCASPAISPLITGKYDTIEEAQEASGKDWNVWKFCCDYWMPDVDRSCSNCLYGKRFEDDLDEDHHKKIYHGRRVGYICDNPNSPLLAGIVKRESNPYMSERNSWATKFACMYWEGKDK